MERSEIRGHFTHGKRFPGLGCAPSGLRHHAGRASAYALVPVNGKLPIGPMPISPDMLSPETLPENSSVRGIGLVIETFQATSSPLAVPSKISVELPSAPCVPVSVPPAFFRLSVALRSPIGVLMTRFQFPSTAISSLLSSIGSQNRVGSGRGIAHLAAQAQPRLRGLGRRPRERLRISPCGTADTIW